MKTLALMALSLCLSTIPVAQAATMEISWQDPERYRDIRGVEGQKSFQKRVIAALSGHFEEVAARTLPADQSLHLTITDVDLAGDVEYFFFRFPEGIRVMRDIYFPSIEFSYELRDADGKVLKSGQENIKDMGYLYSGMVYLHNPPFDYEKHMIDDWFRQTFE